MKKTVVGLLAHVDAGKTTLAESLLYTAGAIRNQGRVDHGDAHLDTDAMEKSRGITIFSKMARLHRGDAEIVLLDTPGHVDFSSEMERTLSVLDMAVLVVSGSEGIQGHTRTLWKLLEHYRVPTFIFINKMDMPGTDKKEILSQLQKGLSANIADMTDDTDVILENISACDENLIEEYLETDSLSDESIISAIADRKVFPVWYGSALKNDGVDSLLDGIAKYSPEPEYGDEFGARVFKITRDDQGKRLTHLKVTGGKIYARMLITLSGIKYAGNDESSDDFGEDGSNSIDSDNVGRGQNSKTVSGKNGSTGNEENSITEKVDQLRFYDGVKYETVSEATAGDIVAVTGLSETYAGQNLGVESGTVIPVLEPVLSYKLIPPIGMDALLLYGKIKSLEEEYPELRITWNEEHKEIHVSVNGEVQIQVLKAIVLKRFDAEIEFGAGSIVYKETLGAPAYGIGHFEPLRHYAEVQLLVEPGEPGSGIEFISACGVDTLDKNWQRLIKTHVEEAVHPGVLTRSEMTDIKVVLMTGRAHPKHTVGGDFRQATYRALRNAFRQAMNVGKAVLLEPVYDFIMEIPTEYIGRAMTDVERLFGKAGAPEISEDGAMAVLKGTAPVSTFWEYQKELNAYTGGRGHLSCILHGFAPCHNQDEITEQKNYLPDDDFRRPTGSVFCAHGAGYQVPWYDVAGLAHMPCPISPREAAGIAGLENIMRIGAAWSSTGDGSDGDFGSYNAVPESSFSGSHEEKTISLEEIDAIFATQYRNRKADAAANRRVYKRGHASAGESRSRGYVGGSLGQRYSGGSKGQESAAGNQDQGYAAGNRSQGYVAGNRSQETAAGKSRTSSVKPKCLLVDGYNMIHAWSELKPLIDTNMDGARGRLVDICSEYQGIVGGELILVFDAYLVSGGTGSVYNIGGIHVVYTKEAETADQYIEQATRKKAADYNVTVATSDRIEQLIVWSDGALRMSAAEFEKEIARARASLRETYLDKHNLLGNTLPLDKIGRLDN